MNVGGSGSSKDEYFVNSFDGSFCQGLQTSGPQACVYNLVGKNAFKLHKMLPCVHEGSLSGQARDPPG